VQQLVGNVAVWQLRSLQLLHERIRWQQVAALVVYTDHGPQHLQEVKKKEKRKEREREISWFAFFFEGREGQQTLMCISWSSLLVSRMRFTLTMSPRSMYAAASKACVDLAS
jgi:hypothetical protein